MIDAERGRFSTVLLQSRIEVIHMAMNPPTYRGLRKMTELIDEINAWNKLLKKHLAEMKKQPAQWDSHKYAYDSKTKKVKKT